MNRSTALTRVAVLAIPLALAPACTVGPDYRAPGIPSPDAWVEHADADASLDQRWWESFHDEELTRLVALAVAANTDLRVAVARVKEVRAQRGVVAGDLWPRVDLSGSYSNSRLSENGFLKDLGTNNNGTGSLPGAIAPGQEINLYQAGVDASWEIDIFGGRRRAVEAADAEISQAQFQLGDALLLVVGEVADEYIRLRGLQERLRIAHETASSEQTTADVVGEQASAGVASELDEARASSQAHTAAARLPDLEARARVSVRRLETLIGALPGTLDEELSAATPVPEAPASIEVGIPSEILRRRPDVRAAERRLAASTARIGVATADLFPRFSLTGSFGYQSQELGDLPESDSRFWSIGPSVRWPILDFGRIRSTIAAQNARTEEAEVSYEGIVITAFSDVEVALVRLSRERRRFDLLQDAANDARRASSVADELYRTGLLDYLDLLDAQRTQYESDDALAQSRAAIAADTVRLYRALGGGWSDPSELLGVVPEAIP